MSYHYWHHSVQQLCVKTHLNPGLCVPKAYHRVDSVCFSFFAGTLRSRMIAKMIKAVRVRITSIDPGTVARGIIKNIGLLPAVKKKDRV